MQARGSVLFLDAATRCGWAEGLPGERPCSGAIRLKQGLDAGDLFADALTWLDARLRLAKPMAVYIETPNIFPGSKTSFAVIFKLFGLCAIFWVVARLHGIRTVRLVNAREVRMYFIGQAPHGDKAKQLVDKECRRLGWIDPDVYDYDRTDALAGWSYACEVEKPGSTLRYVPLFGGAA